MKYVLVSVVTIVFGIVGLLKPISTVFVTVFSPVQFGLHKSAITLIDGTKFFFGVLNLRSENIAFREKVTQLESEIVELKRLEEENSLLRSQLNIESKPTPKKLVLAASMGNPADSSGSTLIIDKGTKDGVKVKDPVVVKNNLVGIIKEVGYSRSHVELLTSSNLSYIVYDLDSKDKTEALAVGKHGSSIGLERILPNEDIKVGDTVVTSGREGIIGAGYIVGKVENISLDPSLPLRSASVRSMIDFSHLGQVFIVIDAQ